MEIERKFLVKEMPAELNNYPHTLIEQGYLSTDPVVRVRRDGDEYYITYKGRGTIAKEEYNLPLNEKAYSHLVKKADGNIITKIRYRIPDGKYTIELDIFEGELLPLVLAEVEFPTVEEARAYEPPLWFGRDVTEEGTYSNSRLSQLGLPEEWRNRDGKNRDNDG